MKKVLIMEDEVNIRSFVVINLKRAGYEPIEAACGQEALDKINGDIMRVQDQMNTQSTAVSDVSSTIQDIGSKVSDLNQIIEVQTSSVNESVSSVEQMLDNIQSVTDALGRSTAQFENLSRVSEIGVQKISATATKANFNMVKNTFIPPKATHLLVYTVNAVGDLSEEYVAVELPEGCNYAFPSGKPLIEFQALSDIHISTEIREEHYKAMLEDVATYSPKSAGIFVAGDVVDSGPQDAWWDKLWELYDDLETIIADYRSG